MVGVALLDTGTPNPLTGIDLVNTISLHVGRFHHVVGSSEHHIRLRVTARAGCASLKSATPKPLAGIDLAT